MPMRSPSRYRHARAFTLIELLCAVVILGMLGSVTAAIVARASASFTSAGIGSQLSSEASTALEVITRRLRDIDGVTGSVPAAPSISSISATSITFNTNSSFTHSGSQVLFSDAGTTALPIVNDVVTFTLSAIDGSGNAIALPISGAGTGAIQRIGITIALRRAGITETLRTQVFIRSLTAGAKP